MTQRQLAEKVPSGPAIKHQLRNTEKQSETIPQDIHPYLRYERNPRDPDKRQMSHVQVGDAINESQVRRWTEDVAINLDS
jgi:hypothetical protein